VVRALFGLSPKTGALWKGDSFECKLYELHGKSSVVWSLDLEVLAVPLPVGTLTSWLTLPVPCFFVGCEHTCIGCECDCEQQEQEKSLRPWLSAHPLPAAVSLVRLTHASSGVGQTDSRFVRSWSD